MRVYCQRMSENFLEYVSDIRSRKTDEDEVDKLENLLSVRLINLVSESQIHKA